MFAEFLANDRPIVMSYKGEILWPVLVDYPESKFGGFLAVTDFKEPEILKEIGENGWAIWPPIGYSYDTINKDYPGRKGLEGLCLGYPAPPPWASSAPLCDAPAEQLARFHAIGNYNWLGLDDQGRDVVARVIYGFRISVLFGLILTVFAASLGVTAGAVQGYFGGRTDLIFQRFLEVWSSIPRLFVLIIISSVLVPGFWTLLGTLLMFDWVNLVAVVRAEFLRARNFEYITAARALGLSHAEDHVEAHAAERHGGDADLPALPALGLDRRAHRARLPRARPAAGFARRWASCCSRANAICEAPWLGLTGFFSVAVMLSLADLRRRGGARRVRPAQDVPLEARRMTAKNALSRCQRPVGALRRRPARRCLPSTASPSASARARRWRSWANRARARPCPRCRSCSCSPIRRLRTPQARSGLKAATS